ncbi:MAG TPA: carboxypeptidase regulatory-like domain-containing protein, partial [Kofleriaceae bacterium]
SIHAPVAVVFATTGADGAFTLAGVDHGAYDLSAEADDHVRVTRDSVLGGSRNVELVLDAGLAIAGHVVDRDGNPIPRFTLIVQRPSGLVRSVVTTRSLIDPAGRFALRVAPGDYELIASARGFARNAPLAVAAGATDLRIVLGGGAILRGQVIASDDIVAIDGVAVAQLGLDRAFASLRGPPGTTVALTLRRGEQYVQLTVERRVLRT